jgi:hypothetical protein
MRTEPSFFGTKMTGEAYGERDGRIIFASISLSLNSTSHVLEDSFDKDVNI